MGNFLLAQNEKNENFQNKLVSNPTESEITNEELELACFVKESIMRGVSDTVVEKELTEKGLSQTDALQFIEFCKEEVKVLRAKALSDAGYKSIFSGFIWVAFGLGATYLSHSFASDDGGYTLFWGAILYGVYCILWGTSHAGNNMISGVKPQSEKFADPAPDPAPAQKNAGGMYIFIGFVLLAVLWVISALCQAIR